MSRIALTCLYDHKLVWAHFVNQYSVTASRMVSIGGSTSVQSKNFSPILKTSSAGSTKRSAGLPCEESYRIRAQDEADCSWSGRMFHCICCSGGSPFLPTLDAFLFNFGHFAWNILHGLCHTAEIEVNACRRSAHTSAMLKGLEDQVLTFACVESHAHIPCNSTTDVTTLNKISITKT
jgi:hypothetical protein